MSELLSPIQFGYDVAMDWLGVNPIEQRNRWLQEWEIQNRKFRDWASDDIVEDAIRKERYRQMQLQTKILEQKYQANLDKARALFYVGSIPDITQAEQSGASSLFANPIVYESVPSVNPEAFEFLNPKIDVVAAPSNEPTTPNDNNIEDILNNFRSSPTRVNADAVLAQYGLWGYDYDMEILSQLGYYGYL